MKEIIISLITGALSGMGIGGGSLLIILLTAFLGVAQVTAQSINLIYFLPCAAVSLFIHLKNGFVDKKTALTVALSGCLSAVPFAYFAVNCDSSVLRKCFAVLVFICGIFQLFKKSR